MAIRDARVDACIEKSELLAAALALKTNLKAKEAFDAFPPSHCGEYVQWIAEAKREETRARPRVRERGGGRPPPPPRRERSGVHTADDPGIDPPH